MTAPLLHRLPSTGRYDKRYRIHGFDHLVVEAEFSDDDFSRPQLMYWLIRDTRFTSGLDKWSRWQVLVVPKLGDARSWIRAGGPLLWDPEKRKTDRKWRPIPDGWAPEEARGKVPRRSDSGVGDVRRVGAGSASDRTVRRGGGDQDFDRDPEVGRFSDFPIGSTGLKRKKYAVAPGWITSANDKQRHWIGFGALTWLYGVDPAECLLADGEKDRVWSKEFRESLIWLYPMYRHEDYETLKQELARGDDAFRLIEP